MKIRASTIQRIARHIRRQLCGPTELPEEIGAGDAKRRKTFERAVWNSICFDTFDLEGTAEFLSRPGEGTPVTGQP